MHDHDDDDCFVASIQPQRNNEQTHTAHHYDIWILDFVSIFIDISMPSNIWRIKAKMLNFYLLMVWWPVHRACVCARGRCGSINGMSLLFRFCCCFFPLSSALSHFTFYNLSIFLMCFSFFRLKCCCSCIAAAPYFYVWYKCLYSNIHIHCLYSVLWLIFFIRSAYTETKPNQTDTDSIRFNVYCIYCIQ